MIICTKCGFQNEDSDTFCGSCAAFLEWAGEKQAVEDPEPEPVEEEPEPVVELGLFERVKERIVGEARTTGSEQRTTDAAPPAVEAPPAAEPPPVAVAVEAPAPVAVSTAPSPSPSPAAPATVAAPAAASTTSTIAAAPPATTTSASAPPSPTAAPSPAITSPVSKVGDTKEPQGLSRDSAAPVVDRAASPVTSAPLHGGSGAPPAASPSSTPSTPATSPTPSTPPSNLPPARSYTTPAASPSSAPTAAPTTGGSPSSTTQTASTPAAPPSQAPAATTAPSTPATTPSTPTADPTAASTTTPVAPTAVAPGPVAPAAVAPGPVAPSAVKPGAVKARPTAKAKAPQQKVINPGDLICGQCGEGNDPIRKFCRRCGASLQQAVTFVPPWWKRALLRLRKRKVRAAGERPHMRRRAFGGAGGGWISSIFTKIVALAIIVFLVLTFVGPFSKTIKHRVSVWYHDVKNAIHTTYNPVHPVGATATSAVSGHPATNAIDNASNTAWEAGGSRSGLGETLTISLQSATNIDKVGFINGDNDTPDAYLSEPRLETVLLTFKSATGSTAKSITLTDSAAFQSYSVSAKQVTSLTITIESVYASAQGQNAALTEVELFRKA